MTNVECENVLRVAKAIEGLRARKNMLQEISDFLAREQVYLVARQVSRSSEISLGYTAIMPGTVEAVKQAISDAIVKVDSEIEELLLPEAEEQSNA